MKRETFSWEELKEMDKEHRKHSSFGWSKEGLVVKSGIKIPGNTINYALPHPWVEHMVDKYKIEYAEIAGTSVMVYNEDNRHGIPMSYCTEIQTILDKEFEMPY